MAVNEDTYININWGRLQAAAVEPGRDALNSTAIWTRARAQHHAPVRSIFQRARRGYEPRIQRMIKLPGHLPFVAKGTGALFFHGKKSAQAFQKSLPHFRQVIDAGNIGRITGHPNSYQPVFHFGGSNETGDFRLYDPKTKSLRVVDTVTTRAGRYGRHQEATYGERSGEQQLSLRGIAEVKSGRAMFQVTHAGEEFSAQSEPRIGGRLRGEITVELAEFAGGSLWAHVTSPTPYARFQEFGTSHNRAHPFLRPALYEARAKLRESLYRAYRPG